MHARGTDINPGSSSDIARKRIFSPSGGTTAGEEGLGDTSLSRARARGPRVAFKRARTIFALVASP